MSATTEEVVIPVWTYRIEEHQSQFWWTTREDAIIAGFSLDRAVMAITILPHGDSVGEIVTREQAADLLT